jgi:hypothetical protein
LAESLNILTPTGSSTANIIVLPITLADKKKYSFKATANSTGLVTINGIAFKKLDSTVIGNGGVKINKVYDFYYDSSASSVFILAKAEGDAVVGDVLAGTIFSNGDDTGLIGTMVDRGTVNITPTTLPITILGGKHSGVGVVAAVANAIADNIKNGVVIAGVTGNLIPMLLVASTLQQVSDSPMQVSAGTMWTPTAKKYTINGKGTIRISFNLWRGGTSGTANAQLYKNGVAVGALRTTTAVEGSKVKYQEDFSCVAGDVFQLYIMCTNSNYSAIIDVFEILYSIGGTPAQPTLTA